MDLFCNVSGIIISTGKQAASSKFCCPFCLGTHPWLGDFEPVTIGSLWRDYGTFVKNGSDPAKGQLSHSVTNVPLITGHEDQKVLGDIIWFPELHVLTGSVSKLMREFERCAAFDTAEEGHKFVDVWFNSNGVNIQRSDYHGSSSFIGNMAKRILTLADDDSKGLGLKVRESLAGDKLEVAEMYVKALSELNDVILACFGMDLTPDYEDRIATFMTTYRSLGISIPLKVQVIFSYYLVQPYCTSTIYLLSRSQH